MAAAPRLESLRSADWLNRQRATVYPCVLLAVFVALIALFLVRWRASTSPTVFPLGADFFAFWTGSSIALGGHPAQVYDTEKMWRAEQGVLGWGVGFEKFDYPPVALGMVLPLSIIPYNWSLLFWTLSGLALYAALVCRIAGTRDVLCAALVFPGAVVTILNGQNGFFTTALLGGGLLLLDSSPATAGVCFGLMCFKPQFGILLPLVLLADRRWRTIAGAALTVFACSALSAALFGIETWRAFIAIVPETTHRILEQGVMGFGKMQSVFGAARLWGASVHAAYMTQAIAAVAAAALVLWLWLRPVRFALKAAALCTGILLVTPYVLDYDLVLLALPIAWMYADGIERSFLPWEKFLLLTVWSYPLFARMLGIFASIPLTPLVLACLMGAIVRRSLASENPAADDALSHAAGVGGPDILVNLEL